MAAGELHPRRISDEVIPHRYSDTAHSIEAASIEHDLPPVLAAVERLRPRA